jgi:N-acyl-D-amino-acid deacylase
MFVFGQSAARPGSWRVVADWLDHSPEVGAPLTAAVHCREFLNVMGFELGLPFDLLPYWKGIRSLPTAEQAKLLQNDQVRRRLVHEALTAIFHDGIGAEIRRPDYERLRVYDTPLGPHRSVASVAASGIWIPWTP